MGDAVDMGAIDRLLTIAAPDAMRCSQDLARKEGIFVGITAGADAISPPFAILVGAIAGAIVVFAIIFFDKIKIDDPVGAISVHGVCGIWGTLAVGLFGGASIISQAIGAAAISGFAFLFSLIVFGLLKVVMGVRVSEEEEIEGLDVAEHGVPAYADFASR